MPRLDTNQGDYLIEIKDQFLLFGTMQGITNNLNDIEEASDKFIGQYEGLKFLWEETLEESFKQFLASGPDLGEEFEKKLAAEVAELDEEEGKYEDEMESFGRMSEKILAGVVTRKPDLEVFDDKIQFLVDVKHKLAILRTSEDIGWLRVNSMPLIKELQ